MLPFDPHEVLDVDADVSPRDLEVAYRRRLRETDPQAVVGLDPSIQEAAHQARLRVELAYRQLTDPDSVSEEELAAVSDAAEEEEEPPTTKSYWRAVMLTFVLPGAGSWYAGGRTRGLVALGAFTLFTVWVISGMQQVWNGAQGTIPRIMALRDYLGVIQGPCYGALAVFLGDAVLATWAHNDRVS